MICDCCGQLIESACCVRCTARTYCSCGALLACGCGRMSGHDRCPSAASSVVTWPIAKIELSLGET